MTRDEKISNCPRLRKGRTTAIVALDKHERRYTESTVIHDSINRAKRENGLDAVALHRWESFPPILRDLPPVDENGEQTA